MTGKSKVVIGAGVGLLAIGVAAWLAMTLARTSRSIERGVPRTGGATTTSNATNSSTAAAPATVEPTLESPTRLPASADDSNPAAATILHVKVVDVDKKPCTSGRLTGLWSEETQLENPQTREVRVIELDIAGETTDIVLPVAAASALLSASVAGHPASRIESIANLRTEEDPKERRGRVERDVTLEVGGGVARPRLSGRILVDGRARVPRGLVVTYPRAAEMRVHALDARYELGPVDWLVNELFVTSEETMPRFVATGFAKKTPPKDETTLDLELSSGVTLRLNVVDRKSGAPLPGIELWLRVDCMPAGAQGLAPKYFQHHVVTGADGIAVVTGLPRDAGFSIRRDATLRKRRVEMLPKPPEEASLPREALLAESIDAASPAVIERTLRIDAQDRTLHLFGDLEAVFLAPGEFGESEAEVRFATLGRDFLFRMPPERRADPWIRNLASIRPDEHGHWQFEVEPGVDYRIWVEREHRRLSEVVTVKAEEADVGPVALPPRPGSDVLLRLVRCATVGNIAIVVKDAGAVAPMGTQYAVHGGTFERRLRLEGATTIWVTEQFDRERRRAQTQRRIVVDPATTSMVEVDLAADEARTIELSLSSGSLPHLALLDLMRVAADGTKDDVVAAEVQLVNGVDLDPVSIEPGRYLYLLSAGRSGGLVVLGVVDVARASGGRPLEIRCELEPHAKSEFGAGIEITEVDGVKATGKSPVLKRLRFADDLSLAGVETILLPKGAKFTILEK